MKAKRLIGLTVGTILILMMWKTFSQKGVSHLDTSFREVARYRNENNTGPVRRVYVVAVNDTNWTDLEAYGNFQPHSKLGTTEVFFFLEGQDVPTTLNGSAPYFSSSYNQQVIAHYEKNPSGLVSFKMFPFR
ncbi:hypothetical protein [Roseivirga sp. UBA838]|uniref:hypothetical protein n=1 Tax=Roseivirga sp. UBA838 TaxID=1947393 RepID=UPI00257A4809|nr:hypothetical protein [Roseivirga sp. UBA838]|tara:strand:+ start:29798 stop:30193 length:396 start_codon:yes stop_codon:yes gene_type:complete